MAWVASRVPELGPLDELDVLEVGSHNVNGSVRELFDGCRHYVGIDPWDGPGVDVPCSIEDYAEPEPYGVVVSCEMLEHAPDPELAVEAITAAVAPGGHLILTTRSEGFPIHEFPADYGRRFSIDEIAELFDTFDVLDLIEDPEAPGVFLHGRMPA